MSNERTSQSINIDIAKKRRLYKYKLHNRNIFLEKMYDADNELNLYRKQLYDINNKIDKRKEEIQNTNKYITDKIMNSTSIEDLKEIREKTHSKNTP